MVKLPHWPIHTGNASTDSLSTMKRILDLLGNPHKKLKNVVHVSGTNGKGSTIAFLSEIIRQEGFTANVYTSPHIFDFSERFCLNGNNALNEQIFYALEEVRAVCEKANIYPTVLEASTAAAFCMFALYPADYNIIECCMGGLRDCTNVFDESKLVCTIITSISKDHAKHLGETIAEIAFQKASIQRKGVPSIIAKQKEEDAGLLLYNYGKKFDIPTFFFGVDYSIEHIDILDDETVNNLKIKGVGVEKDSKLLFQDENHCMFLPMPSLLGEHQLENLATALKAVSVLAINAPNVYKAVLNTKWVGRLQRVYGNHFPSGCEVWFDGAHNAGGMKVLREWIEATRDERDDYIVIGKSKGVDQHAFVNELKGMNAKIMFVTVGGEIFPEVSTNLHQIAKEVGVDSIDAKTFCDAVEMLPNKSIRLIGCGSLYLLKDIKKS